MRISLHRRPALAVALLIGPVVVTIALFMLAPLGLMGVVSFLEKGVNGGVRWGNYTVEPYVQFLFERDRPVCPLEFSSTRMQHKW
ncbi:MAG: hypothetical protein L0210_10330 [Rhodospirillales bacterium]|nr:hypothetical protein [Rhodospirillales bacterium]